MMENAFFKLEIAPSDTPEEFVISYSTSVYTAERISLIVRELRRFAATLEQGSPAAMIWRDPWGSPVEEATEDIGDFPILEVSTDQSEIDDWRIKRGLEIV
jgi:hypothetical protein